MDILNSVAGHVSILSVDFVRRRWVDIPSHSKHVEITNLDFQSDVMGTAGPFR